VHREKDGEHHPPQGFQAAGIRRHALTAVDNRGDIAVLAGIEDVTIGDTICNQERPGALPRIRVDEPTVSMKFTINNSPFSGKEGKYVQSSRIRERLQQGDPGQRGHPGGGNQRPGQL
jgi:predicted membrane GTPase involved in stress response